MGRGTTQACERVKESNQKEADTWTYLEWIMWQSMVVFSRSVEHRWELLALNVRYSKWLAMYRSLETLCSTYFQAQPDELKGTVVNGEKYDF